MVLKLYMSHISPPCRGVLLLAKALNIELEHIIIEVDKGPVITEELLKINPQGTIPTLVDGEKIIWDSHAINTYLISTYSNNKDLYPEDAYVRAQVDQRLHFDTGVLYPPLRFAALSLFREGKKEMPPVFYNAIVEAYNQLEKFLDGHKWMVGDIFTVADLSLLAIVTSSDIFIPLNPTNHSNIRKWIEKGQQLPYYDVNSYGLNMLREFVIKKRAVAV